MLKPSEAARYFDTREDGLFEDIYERHNGGDVPLVLRAIELLSSGEKIGIDSRGELVLAGTVRDRPYGFRPYTVLVERKGPVLECATVEVPLHYYDFSDDGYGHRIIGGGNSRRWVSIGSMELTPEGVGDTTLGGLTASLGDEQLSGRISQISNTLTKEIFSQLIELHPDIHMAHGPMVVEQFSA